MNKKKDFDIKTENFDIKEKKDKLSKMEGRLSTVPIRLTEAIKEKKDEKIINKMFQNYINLQNDIWELKRGIYISSREYLLRNIGALQDNIKESEKLLAEMVSDRYCLLKQIRKISEKQKYSIWDEKIVKIISPHMNLGDFRNKLAAENKRKSSKQREVK